VLHVPVPFLRQSRRDKATWLIGQYWMTGDANDILPDCTETKGSTTQTGDAVNDSLNESVIKNGKYGGQHYR